MQKLTFLLSLLPLFAGGQSVNTGLDSLAFFYSDNQKHTLPVHNGRLYYGYPQTISDPFYPSPQWQKGSVMFEGHWYPGVSLMYDTYTDDVILLHPNSTPIVLFAERISAFSLDSLRFVRMHPDKDNVLLPGFYQQALTGNVNLLVKRKKVIEENIVDLRVERKFVTASLYYIEREGSYHVVSSKKMLLSLLKDQRQAIKRHIKYLRSRNLGFKQDKEAVITEAVRIYNQLSR